MFLNYSFGIFSNSSVATKNKPSDFLGHLLEALNFKSGDCRGPFFQKNKGLFSKKSSVSCALWAGVLSYCKFSWTRKFKTWSCKILMLQPELTLFWKETRNRCPLLRLQPLTISFFIGKFWIFSTYVELVREIFNFFGLWTNILRFGLSSNIASSEKLTLSMEF